MRTVLALALVVLATLSGCKEEEPNDIPTPPPGYEFCVTDEGQGLGFCQKEKA